MDAQVHFREAIDRVLDVVSGQPLGQELENKLASQFPKNGDVFRALKQACVDGEREGWAMSREAAGIKYGRVISASPESSDMSVDIVRMDNITGPAHTHPRGEIGAVIPISGSPVFDDRWDGWYVYEPGSRHSPKISDGDAYVIYFLPGGEIDFAG